MQVDWFTRYIVLDWEHFSIGSNKCLYSTKASTMNPERERIGPVAINIRKQTYQCDYNFKTLHSKEGDKEPGGLWIPKINQNEILW